MCHVRVRAYDTCTGLLVFDFCAGSVESGYRVIPLRRRADTYNPKATARQVLRRGPGFVDKNARRGPDVCGVSISLSPGHLLMCMRVHACAYLCMRAHVHARARAHTHTHTHTCVCVCEEVVREVCVFSCVHACVFATADHVCVHACLPTILLQSGVQQAARIRLEDRRQIDNRCSRAA